MFSQWEIHHKVAFWGILLTVLLATISITSHMTMEMGSSAVRLRDSSALSAIAVAFVVSSYQLS